MADPILEKVGKLALVLRLKHQTLKDQYVQIAKARPRGDENWQRRIELLLAIVDANAVNDWKTLVMEIKLAVNMKATYVSRINEIYTLSQVISTLEGTATHLRGVEAQMESGRYLEAVNRFQNQLTDQLMQQLLQLLDTFVMEYDKSESLSHATAVQSPPLQ